MNDLNLLSTVCKTIIFGRIFAFNLKIRSSSSFGNDLQKVSLPDFYKCWFQNIGMICEVTVVYTLEVNIAQRKGFRYVFIDSSPTMSSSSYINSLCRQEMV